MVRVAVAIFRVSDEGDFCASAGITALSLLMTPFLMQACRHILRDGSGGDGSSGLPTVSRPPVLLRSLHQHQLCGVQAM